MLPIVRRLVKGPAGRNPCCGRERRTGWNLVLPGVLRNEERPEDPVDLFCDKTVKKTVSPTLPLIMC